MSAVAQSEVGETEDAEWPIVPLGELCRIELGRTPARAHALNWDEKRSTGNVWLSIADMPTSLHAKAKDSYEYVSDSAAEGMKIVPEGTLLVSFKLTLGRLCYAGRDLFTNEAIAAILDLDESRIMLPFLYWYLTYFDWDAAAAGDHKIKGKTLNKAKLKALRVIVPPLEEQKRIVAVLDQAFAALDRARAHAEANLADAQRLFGLEVDRMRRSPAPSWPVLKLEKLAAVISGQHILAGEYNSERRGIGYLTGPSDFGDKRPIVSKWTEYPKRTAIRGDILITVKGSGVGSLNMMVEDELAISRQLMAIRTKPNLREFIYLTLEASYQHFQGLANGAAIPGISRSDVLDFELAMPTSAELPSLLNRLRTLRANSDRLAQGYSDRLTDIATLRQSLLQKAFSGELT